MDTGAGKGKKKSKAGQKSNEFYRGLNTISYGNTARLSIEDMRGIADEARESIRQLEQDYNKNATSKSALLIAAEILEQYYIIGDPIKMQYWRQRFDELYEMRKGTLSPRVDERVTVIMCELEIESSNTTEHKNTLISNARKCFPNNPQIFQLAVQFYIEISNFEAVVSAFKDIDFNRINNTELIKVYIIAKIQSGGSLKGLYNMLRRKLDSADDTQRPMYETLLAFYFHLIEDHPNVLRLSEINFFANDPEIRFNSYRFYAHSVKVLEDVGAALSFLRIEKLKRPDIADELDEIIGEFNSDGDEGEDHSPVPSLDPALKEK